MSELFATIQPEVVVNCSALSVPDYCEQHPAEAKAMNVEAVRQLALLCKEKKTRLIHLSTDYVFEGKENKLHTEDDETHPLNCYGISKLEGEKVVTSLMTDYAIVRVVVVYGKPIDGQHGNICQLVKNRLTANQEVRVVSDQWRTPTWVGDVAIGVEKLVQTSCSGIYHICGEEYLSIADLAYRLADLFHLDRSLIHPVTTEEMKEPTPRPRFSGLSIRKAKQELGYQPHTLEDVFMEMI